MKGEKENKRRTVKENDKGKTVTSWNRPPGTRQEGLNYVREGRDEGKGRKRNKNEGNRKNRRAKKHECSVSKGQKRND